MKRLYPGRKPSAQEHKIVEDRHRFFMTLNPKHLVIGRSGFQRYCGAMLREDLVVFENEKYGNAVYVMYGDWEELSQRSRVELLSGIYGTRFDRVVHTQGWQERVKKIIAARLQPPENSAS